MGSASSRALIEVNVTWFTSERLAGLIYFASTSWMALLIAAECSALGMDRWTAAHPVLVACVVLNACAYAAQTVDYALYHFALWPVTAANWCGQLGALGAAGALVAHATREPGSERDAMTVSALLHLAAQALFTASQFAVTLEYVERSLRRLHEPPRADRMAERRVRVAIGGRRV